MKLSGTAAAATLGFGSAVSAQTAKNCPVTDVCYSLNFPDTTASSGSGDIFFQLTAPTTYQWIAMGQGTSMSGANIFIIYTDASGTNVTLSPRLGVGQVEPDFDSAAQVELLAGSGVSNGVMTANVKCSSCGSWSGGTMDFSSSSTNWIWAEKSGDALNSDSTSESITQHDSMGTMSFQSSSAKGGSSVNPFVVDSASSGSASGSGSTAASSAASTCVASSSGTSGSSGSVASSTLVAPSGSGCPTSWPTQYSTAWPSSVPSQYISCIPTQYQSAASAHGSWPTKAPYVKRDTCDTGSTDSGSASTGSDSSGSSNSGSSNSGGSYGGGSFSQNNIPFGGDYRKASAVMMAHGICAALAFVVFFPTGGIIIRLLSFPGLIWLHAAIQAIGYLLFIAAFGLGIYLATQTHQLNAAHPIIGIVLFILLFFQPILGLLHHFLFKKYQRRVVWSYGHIWLGRIIITVGIINGGLGLKLAGNATQGQEIAYSVVAAMFWLVYVVAAVIGEIRRRRTRNAPPKYEKATRMNNMSDDSPERVGNGNTEYYAKRSRRY